MLYSTDGLVIREVAVGEHDTLITLLTPTEGQISVSAKGARSLHSKYLNTTKLFTYGNYEIYRTGERRYLRDAALIEPFFGISTSLESMALASYLCEIACDITGEDIPSVDILRLTLNSFYALANALRPPALIKGVYEMRAAGYSGFMPNLTGCACCGCEFPVRPRFDIVNGRLFCAACLEKVNLREEKDKVSSFDDMADAKRISLPVGPSALAALRYAVTATAERMFSFDITDAKESRQFGDACEAYLLYHLERGFSTLTFYKSVL